jgi:hypothetical protein
VLVIALPCQAGMTASMDWLSLSERMITSVCFFRKATSSLNVAPLDGSTLEQRASIRAVIVVRFMEEMLVPGKNNVKAKT